MYFSRIFIKSLGIIVLILLNSCQEKNNKFVGMDRSPDKIYIESPIEARLKIEKEDNNLIAILTFINMSDEDVIINRQRLGGNKLTDNIFHLSPKQAGINLTFKPKIKESTEYLVIKPQEVITTQTSLKEYYDFDELKYDSITIGYTNPIPYLDKDHQQIKQKYTDDKMKPVFFLVKTNKVRLDYTKDIKPYL